MKNVETPILEIKNLKQHFDVGSGRKHIYVKAVDGVSFSIKKGETFGLVGESGCGKTTTGRSIINLYNITDGEVILDGVKIAQGVATYVSEIEQIIKEHKKAKKSLKINEKIKIIELNAKIKISKLKAKIDDTNQLKFAEEIASYLSEIKQLSEEYKTAKKSGTNDNKKLKKNYRIKISELKAKVKEVKQLSVQEVASYVSEIRQIKKQNNSTLKSLKSKDKIKISELKSKVKDAKHLNNESKHYYDKIQMIFQDPIASLNPRMTVKEIIAEGLRIHGEKDDNVIKQKVSDILQVVGLLPEHAFRYPHEFSGGQRQRIGVARALVINPDILIADEPISALDVSIQAQVINLLNDLKDKFGLTVLFIAHDLSVVKYFSDRIAVMYFGKIVELADSKELFENALHPYTKSLLSAIPIPDPINERNRKRIHYDKSSHNYDENNQPSLVEIKPGHFVSASPSELEEYKKLIK